MSSGFAGSDDQYNIYDKALFKGGSAGSALYRPTQRKDDDWDDEDKAAANPNPKPNPSPSSSPSPNPNPRARTQT